MLVAILLSTITSLTAIAVALINTRTARRAAPAVATANGVSPRISALEEIRDRLVGQVADLEIRCSRAEDDAREAQREVAECRNRESGLWARIGQLQRQIDRLTQGST